MNLKEVIRQLLRNEYKTYLGNKEGPDATISRSGAHRAGNLGTDEPNTQQASGKDIADKMDFDKETPRNIRDNYPLKMMDIVMKSWGIEDSDEPEEDEEE